MTRCFVKRASVSQQFFQVGFSTICTTTDKINVCVFGTSFDSIVNIQCNPMRVVRFPHYWLWTSRVIGLHWILTIDPHDVPKVVRLSVEFFNFFWLKFSTVVQRVSEQTRDWQLSQRVPCKTGTHIHVISRACLSNLKCFEWNTNTLWNHVLFLEQYSLEVFCLQVMRKRPCMTFGLSSVYPTTSWYSFYVKNYQNQPFLLSYSRLIQTFMKM